MRAKHGLEAGKYRIVWAPIDEISPLLVFAVVRSEDPKFFKHRGVAWNRMALALYDGFAGRGWKGASTISQQVARNLALTPERSLSRKIREIRLALELERAFSKKRILETYLNVAEWAPGIWGIRSASHHYFRKPPSALGLASSAFLASLLPAPCHPFVGRNAIRALNVQFRLAFQMHGASLASSELARRVQAQIVVALRAASANCDMAEIMKPLQRVLNEEITESLTPPSIEDLIADECRYEVLNDLEAKIVSFQRRQDRQHT